MNLEYAVDRLYEVGWTPAGDPEVETLANGRAFPSLPAVQREFEQAGLELAISHNPQFNCYRATWNPAGDSSTPGRQDDRHGTVIGACEREAAVYALAQLRATLSQQQLAAV